MLLITETEFSCVKGSGGQGLSLVTKLPYMNFLSCQMKGWIRCSWGWHLAIKFYEDCLSCEWWLSHLALSERCLSCTKILHICVCMSVCVCDTYETRWNFIKEEHVGPQEIEYIWEHSSHAHHGGMFVIVRELTPHMERYFFHSTGGWCKALSPEPFGDICYLAFQSLNRNSVLFTELLLLC